MQTASLAHDPDAIDIDLAEKRFKILETRDKVVRDVLIQELREGAQVGICADLCPEKEIYRRWTQQDISVLEFNSNGQIDIEKCVKVYQRSAADTEESLPNELRPASTLLDCCWYFCSEVCTEEVIANVGADVWYDFMWKRTRAIRKDITQQHMSCLATAQVLETVARYHIWCSHSMVLEEFWEQRINDENLEKTLTSIEHVYQDISVRGQYSPAEPEFRAYMIYLNLNDSGAVMKYLSCVPKRFKMHPLIKRARRIVSAYMLRHYAIFWNEFSKCTALEASILHRYMENVRYQAMQILRRGYANNVLPLKCFQRALFFKENDPNFETYMAAHNVFPNDEGEVSIVEMAKSYVAEPDEALPKWKSKYIMEELTADRTPGQLIWGSYSSLKPWATKNYKPSSSFLPRSTTLIESAKDIIDNVRAKLEENAQLRNQSPQEDVAAREIEEEVTKEVVVGQLREIASSCKIEGKIIAKQAMDNMSLILDNHIGWEIKRIYKNMLLRDRLMKEEEKNRIAEEKERAQQKRERWTSEFLNECFTELRDSTTNGFLLHFVETSVDEQILKRNDEICTETAHIESENLLENVISRSVRMFMTEEVSETKRLFQQKVAAVRQKRRDRISKQAARWWIRRTRIAIRYRQPHCFI
jgi:germinal-center associated nuclear protein